MRIIVNCPIAKYSCAQGERGAKTLKATITNILATTLTCKFVGVYMPGEWVLELTGVTLAPGERKDISCAVPIHWGHQDIGMSAFFPAEKTAKGYKIAEMEYLWPAGEITSVKVRSWKMVAGKLVLQVDWVDPPITVPRGYYVEIWPAFKSTAPAPMYFWIGYDGNTMGYVLLSPDMAPTAEHYATLTPIYPVAAGNNSATIKLWAGVGGAGTIMDTWQGVWAIGT